MTNNGTTNGQPPGEPEEDRKKRAAALRAYEAQMAADGHALSSRIMETVSAYMGVSGVERIDSRAVGMACGAVVCAWIGGSDVTVRDAVLMNFFRAMLAMTEIEGAEIQPTLGLLNDMTHEALTRGLVGPRKFPEGGKSDAEQLAVLFNRTLVEFYTAKGIDGAEADEVFCGAMTIAQGYITDLPAEQKNHLIDTAVKMLTDQRAPQ